MKQRRLLVMIALIGATAFTSCKKNYTCTCTTVVGTASTTETHSISDEYRNDAQNTCNNYQTQANNVLPGGTTCSL